MRKPLILFGGVVVLGVAGFWTLTAPKAADPDVLAAVAGATGDVAHGEQVFWAAGCASCHAAPEVRVEAPLVLAGGQTFPSEFGTFVAPNISPDPTHGIGAWSVEEFTTALTRGVSPDGQSYYPAFPYTAYIRMTPTDIADLWAFMATLPASATPSQPQDVGFPFNIRRLVGGWKFLFLNDDWVLPTEGDAELDRGRYLVEALAHCGECHTPRGTLGALDTARWMAGAPNPSGRGTIPNLTPAKLTWDASEVAYYLETGFTPDFDSVGGHMAAVVRNFARLPAEDRQAVAAYVKALPPAE
jgi:mono/diheme cytochrome c family protein